MHAVPLTPQQAELLGYIAARLETSEVGPSYDEMRTHLGLKSKGGVARLVDGLVERGHLVRMRGRARGLGLRRPNGEASVGLVQRAAAAERDGLPVRLPPALAMRLLRYCDDCGVLPADVIATALIKHLRGQP